MIIEMSGYGCFCRASGRVVLRFFDYNNLREAMLFLRFLEFIDSLLSIGFTGKRLTAELV